MIIFLYGPDSFRSRRLLKEMKAKFVKEVDKEENSLDTIDGKEADLQKITERMNTGSLFAQKRMLIIENIFQNKKTGLFSQLEKYLPRLEKSNDIIIIFKDKDIPGLKTLTTEAKKLFSFLNKQKYTQEFKLLSPAGLNNFTKKETEMYKKRISREAANELVARTGGDLWLMSQSIKKACLGTEKKLIGLEDIKQYTTEKFNENIFSLTDALSAKNKNKALKILEEQYAAGVSDEYLISMLIRQFKILLQIKEAQEMGLKAEMIASHLKLHPFIIKKGLSQTNNFSSSKLKLYFNKMICLDNNNKTGRGDIKSELSILIAEI
jgi:DNA polymerase III subunit delta